MKVDKQSFSVVKRKQKPRKATKGKAAKIAETFHPYPNMEKGLVKDEMELLISEGDSEKSQIEICQSKAVESIKDFERMFQGGWTE